MSGGGRGEILPTSPPELPIQLRGLRNNQKALKTYFYVLEQHPKLILVFPSKGAAARNFFLGGVFAETDSEMGPTCARAPLAAIPGSLLPGRRTTTTNKTRGS